MKISTMIIGVLLFMAVTMLLYGWGIIKQKHQSEDLMNLLFSKGMSRVNKYLKKHESITMKEVEVLCENLQAKMPFSANRAVVRDKKDFARQLLQYMEKTGQLEKNGSKYKRAK
jgi:hypothetical protein